MLSIGEFSRVTQLTIKALRLYHEKGLLIPDKIDYDSKYRYYRSSSVSKGLVIKHLKDMGFSLNEIKNIMFECNDDKQIVSHVEEKLKEISDTIKQFEEKKENLSMFLSRTGDEKMIDSIDVEEEVILNIHICSIRFKGKYMEVGSRFMDLFKKCGRYAKGKPFSLYYDSEYKEDGADIEACVEVKKELNFEGIKYSELKGGKAITVIHRGPYEEFSRSYQRLFEYCREHNLKTRLPLREQYIKGPGMIFRGNPRKYITKLMMLYE